MRASCVRGEVRTAVVAALLPLAGCSWIGMTRPPGPPVAPSPPATCTTSRLAPSLDTIGAVLIGVPAVAFTTAAIATPACGGSGGWDCFFQFPTPGAKAATVVLGLAFVGLAVVDTVSAVNGFAWADACDGVRNLQLSCASGVEASCQGLRDWKP